MKKRFFCLFVVLFLYTPVIAQEGNSLLIAEIKVAGITAKDEYVKICNYSNKDKDIKGFRLEKITASGKTIQPLVKSIAERIIVSGDCIIVYHPDSQLQGDVLYDGAGTIAKDNAIRLLGSNKEIIDLVGFGNVSPGLYLGFPAPNPENYQVLLRKEGQNTNNNFDDFFLFGEEVSSKKEPVENNNTPSPAPVVNNPPVINQAINNYQTAKIIISELYSNPTKEEGEPSGEFIELYNPNSFEVNLFGWSIEDTVGRVNKYIIRESLIIKTGGYIVINNLESKINLNNEGDSVILKDPFDKIIYTTPNYTKSSEGKSFSLISEQWKWTSYPTPGYPNKEDNILIEKKEELEFKNYNSEVLGVTSIHDPVLLQKNKNSGILLFLMAGIIIVFYFVYLNRGEIEKRILYKKRRGN